MFKSLFRYSYFYVKNIVTKHNKDLNSKSLIYRKIGPQFSIIVLLFLSFLDYEDACSQKVEDKSITYFQIKNANGYMLELNYNSDSELPDSRAGKTFQFSPNEYKDSQFWYWHQQPNSDYGYIGSKLNVKKVLSIAFSSDFENNGNVTHF